MAPVSRPIILARAVEILNLGGLPEAEALRLPGVDEKGTDLRGKAGAAKQPRASLRTAGQLASADSVWRIDPEPSQGRRGRRDVN